MAGHRFGFFSGCFAAIPRSFHSIENQRNESGTGLPHSKEHRVWRPCLIDRANPMRAVVQRVSRAQVTVAGEITGQIGRGLAVLLGVAQEDSEVDSRYLAEKICGLRIFPDSDDKMNRSLEDVGGAMLVVSQFTLLGDCRRGRRPSFVAAAAPERAEELYEVFVAAARDRGISVECGRFRAHMDVELVNEGPVTLMLDSEKPKTRGRAGL